MANRNYIDVLIRMLEAAKFQRDAKKSAQAVKEVGDKAEKTGEKTSTSLKSLAKWAASAYIFHRAAGYLEGAVHETEDLAKASLSLQRLTGLDVKTSSEWVVVAKTRNIEGQRLGMMFTQLGRVQQRAIAGSKLQARAFESIGISVRDLQRLNTTDLVKRISDAFAAMPNGLQKAALAQQFFGRTGRQLLPILNEGGASLQEQLDLVEKYGAALEGKTAEDVKLMIKRQRELTIAQMGFKEQLSDALIPTLTALSGVLRDFLQIARPVLKNQTAMRVILISLAIAWGIYTIATIAAAIATAGFGTILAATGIGAAIILLALIVVKWDEVSAALERVKNHWVLVAAILAPAWLPVVLAIKVVIDSFGFLEKKILAVYNKIKGPLSVITGVVSKIAHPGSLIPSFPRFATGGTMVTAGMALVGERGPELVHLPGGSRVQPLDHSTPDEAGGSREITLHNNVYLDSKLVARSVAKAVADEGARR